MKKHITLNKRLFIVTMCIALPIIAVILWTGFQNKNSQRKAKFAQDTSEVEIAVSQLDTMIELLQNSLNNLSLDDSDFKLIATAREPSTEFWLANERVMQRMASQAGVISLEFTPFVYFPDVDIFYNYKVQPEMAELIREQVVHKAETPLEKNWHTLWCDDSAYLYFIIDYKNYYIGAWGRYTAFNEILKMMPGDGEKYYFTDASGQVLSGGANESTMRITGLDHAFDGSAARGLPYPVYKDGEDQEWYMSTAASTQADFQLIKLTERGQFEAQLPGVTRDLLIATGIFTVLFLVYILCLYRWILVPVGTLRTSMEIIQSGNLDYRIPELDNGSVEFDAVISEFNFLMNHIENLKIEMYEARLEQNETKLEYLSRQIQPHFILNTLNTLYNYSESDVKAAKAIIRLASGYYRYVVNVNSKYVQLGQELEHIDHYLSLQKLRYPKAFEYTIQCADALRITPVPPFIIESFVGNAVKYGITPGKPSEIQVKVEEIENFRIRIRIADRGKGFSEDTLDAVREYLEEGIISEELGVGIRNSVARLRLIYRDRCSVRIYNQQPQGAVVDIELMLQEDEDGYTGIDRG